jgi:hypothetical protein
MQRALLDIKEGIESGTSTRISPEDAKTLILILFVYQ